MVFGPVFSEIPREGFLADDMFSCPGCLDAEFLVKVRRDTEINDVHIVAFEEAFVVIVMVGNGVSIRKGTIGGS